MKNKISHATKRKLQDQIEYLNSDDYVFVDVVMHEIIYIIEKTVCVHVIFTQQ